MTARVGVAPGTIVVTGNANASLFGQSIGASVAPGQDFAVGAPPQRSPYDRRISAQTPTKFATNCPANPAVQFLTDPWLPASTTPTTVVLNPPAQGGCCIPLQCNGIPTAGSRFTTSTVPTASLSPNQRVLNPYGTDSALKGATLFGVGWKVWAGALAGAAVLGTGLAFLAKR